MTPEETQEIAFAGAEFLDNISSLIFMCALTGIYILAFIISVHILLRRKSNGRARKSFIAFLTAGLGLVILYSSQNITLNLLLVNFGLMWAGTLLWLMADMAIIWRAWAIRGRNRLVKWALLLILLLDIGVNIADVIVDTRLSFNPAITTVTLDWLSILLNLMVNVVATFLIAYRAWSGQFTSLT
ncbi:hypothetical protein BT96DRAFT_938151 [Gymnopus androsaceus JB14]|uniref:Uncharacterized protein n=1 Tax=Gymnopus androsaceus JB14 TaxID=1447944 RepID=A0A6A4HTA3_9AGAR|nr:hypothetical protein BT96DRAFT_938151 [Gymnopus androsaceus JB14]